VRSLRSLPGVQVLVLDTSCPQVLAALVRVAAPGTAPRVLAEHAPVDARRHGELLAVGIREVLSRPAGAGGARPDAIVVGAGPGPFTGLRVGLVSAAALSDAWAVPAYAVCSLDGIARPGRTCVVVTDARRREIYWARYDAGGRRRAGPAVERPAVLAEQLRAEKSGVLCGAGALLHADELAGLDVEADAPYPSAQRLVLAAADRVLAGAPPDPLTPLYLRRPDATPPRAPKRVTEAAPG